jgi:HAD superfamily hydrolase (TIGR01484 family)
MPSHLSQNKIALIPKKWDEASPSDLEQIQGVCLDIDDTLSTGGKLTAEAYASLWELKKAGFFVVPITGRPAGWCDHFARFWPVDAVIGENGAFTFFMEKGIRKRINTPTGEEESVLKLKLTELSHQILNQFPHAKWASDQAYREYDLAIDICEDVKPWEKNRVDALLDLCHQSGAYAKLSSIHVNTWFGNYDKRKGFEHWIKSGAPGLKTQAPRLDQWLFIGDSPNDEPLFASFRYSVGVANLTRYLDRLQHPPTWITDLESGQGFSQMANRLIKFKKSRS